ncbi:MAG: hypothetical protein KAU50_07845 [Candidatus Marinimicrobia bacterium]|nr:hypothetical protein [Candidatus Neomarinimicrobiota bacterium]
MVSPLRLALYALLALGLFVACPTEPDPVVCPEYYHPCTDDPDICCPDTTSHEFVWEVYHLGELTSRLFDVYAASEDDIWAVGAIMHTDTIHADSSTTWRRKYNTAHWNGYEWELRRIPHSPLYPGGTIDTFYSDDMRSVYGFPPDSTIWFNANTASLTRWDGRDYTFFHPRYFGFGGVWEMWGPSDNILYLVGYNGGIARYNGSYVSPMNTATDVYLRDVWGSSDGSYVWTCGYKVTDGAGSVLMLNDGIGWQTHWYQYYDENANLISDTTQSYVGHISSLWQATEDSLIVVGGNGIWWQDIRGEGKAKPLKISLQGFPNKVRGSGRDNIFIVGSGGLIWHFNGATWKKYNEFNNPIYYFSSVAVLKDMVVIIGEDFSEGVQKDIIIIGRRME